MPNQDQQQQPAGGLGFVVGLLQKGGKWGAIGVFIAGVGEFALGITNAVKFHAIMAGAEDFAHGLVWTGAAIALGSISFHAKRGNELTVTTAAKAEIDRSVILNAMTPADVTVVPQSSEPAVNREIVKQLRESANNLKRPDA